MKQFFFRLYFLLSVLSVSVSCTEAQVQPIPITGLQPKQYSDAVQSVFSQLSNLTDHEKIWIADFVDRQVASGVWANILEFQCRAMQTESNSLQGWKGVFDATNAGSATHVPGYGFTYNGTSTYINTGFIPATHGGSLYVQNDAGVGVFIKQVTTTAQTGYVFGAFDAASRRTTLMQNNGASIDYRINGATATAYSTDTRLYRGMYSIRRTSSSAVAVAANGNQLATAAQTSNALTNQPLYEGALNTSGSVTAGSYLGVDVGAFFVFKGSTTNLGRFYSDLVVLMYHLERTTYPTWLQLVPFLVGQSNAAGDCTETPSTSELQAALTNCYMYNGSWVVLEYGVNNGGDTGGAGQNFGCELTLAQRLRDYYSREVRMLKHARGGAAVHIIVGTPNYNIAQVNGGDYYPSLSNYFDGGHTNMHRLDVCPMFVRILVHGEAERNSADDATKWLFNWSAIETGLNNIGATWSYSIIAKVNSGLSFDTSAPILSILRAKPDERRNSDPTRIFVYDMNDNGSLNMSNYPHYHGAQYETMGVNLANICINQILVP